MTTRRITISHNELGMSICAKSLQSFSYGNSVTVDVEAVAPKGIGEYRKSRSGRVPRAVASAIAEQNDVRYRSEQQEARAELAKEFLGDEPDSLAKLRLQRGYSQQQLASRLGTSQPHVANLEAGKIEPQFDTVARLADALGISLDAIRPLIEAARRKQSNVR